jgi:hypothetical protein
MSRHLNVTLSQYHAVLLFCRYFASTLLGATLAGTLADRDMIKEIFWLAVFPAAQVAVPVLMGQ